MAGEQMVGLYVRGLTIKQKRALEKEAKSLGLSFNALYLRKLLAPLPRTETNGEVILEHEGKRYRYVGVAK